LLARRTAHFDQTSSVSAMTRAVLLSACRAVGPSLAQTVRELASQHAEVIVAIDDVADESGAVELPRRWAEVRGLLAAQPSAWVTPLVRWPSSASRAEQSAALQVRLGAIQTLRTDSGWLPYVRALGLNVELLPDLTAAPARRASPALGSRALVVLRAQPFHFGHLALIKRALTLADEVIVVVAAAERAFSARDPFTAGERLALLRAGLGSLRERVWLVALPAPAWPASALAQLAFVAPDYAMVVAHNPILRALAAQQGKTVTGLERPLEGGGERLSASMIRARLSREGAGTWLRDVLPPGTAELLAGTPSLAQRCATIAAAGE
jgi:nicotinamide-nucleotide adenylyltransferase